MHPATAKLDPVPTINPTMDVLTEPNLSMNKAGTIPLEKPKFPTAINTETENINYNLLPSLRVILCFVQVVLCSLGPIPQSLFVTIDNDHS